MNGIPLISQNLGHANFPSSQTAVLVYFSAHWCGPCRQFTPLLKTFYDFAKESGADLEIVFVSSDRSEHEMVQYYQHSHGSWLAVPFYSTQRNFLSSHFNVKGIPALFLLNKGTLHAVEEDVRSSIQQVAMMRNAHRVNGIVDSWRERSGATLFQSIPASLSMLCREDRESVFELLSRLLTNISDHPTESKYRQIRFDNSILTSTILEKPCQEFPLSAIGFYKTSSFYEYRPSGVDPSTVCLILANRGSNGLADLAACAKISPTVSASLVAAPQVGQVRKIEGKFRIFYRDHPPIETEEPQAYESMELVSAVIESLTEVSSEDQILYSSQISKSGPILDSSETGMAFNMAFSTNPVVDILVMERKMKFSTDEEANKNASELRSKIAALGTDNIALSTVFNAVVQCQIYQVPSHQAKALEVVPVLQLHLDAQTPKKSYSEEFFKKLLNWFKIDFFKWVDKPRCGQCSSVSTSLVNGKAPPTLQEAKGLATVVELYACDICGSMTRFPRFNHPVALLHTRAGRCGEWSNCFALIAIALGYEIRRVYDSADHVWIEVWMEHRREWVHCDPCENAYDQPLLYEQGWGKECTFTFACCRDGVQDVSRRYTQKKIPTSPTGSLKTVLRELNSLLQQHAGEDCSALIDRDEEEEIALNFAATTDASKSLGRQSGSADWIAARGEGGSFFIGNDNDEIEASKCVGSAGGLVPFSDEHLVRSAAADAGIPRIVRVELWINESELLTGIHCQYEASDCSDTHLATDAIGKSPSATLDLEKGSYITQIDIRFSDSGISGIRFGTNTEEVSVGDMSTGVLADIGIIPGTHVIGVMGTMGSVINTLGILTAPVPPEE